MLFGSPPSCSRCDTAASGIGVIVTLDFTFTTTTLVVVFTCDVWSREQPFNAVSRSMLTDVFGTLIPQMVRPAAPSAPELVVRDSPIAAR